MCFVRSARLYRNSVSITETKSVHFCILRDKLQPRAKSYHSCTFSILHLRNNPPGTFHVRFFFALTLISIALQNFNPIWTARCPAAARLSLSPPGPRAGSHAPISLLEPKSSFRCYKVAEATLNIEFMLAFFMLHLCKMLCGGHL